MQKAFILTAGMQRNKRRRKAEIAHVFSHIPSTRFASVTASLPPACGDKYAANLSVIFDEQGFLNSRKRSRRYVNTPHHANTRPSPHSPSGLRASRTRRLRRIGSLHSRQKTQQEGQRRCRARSTFSVAHGTRVRAHRLRAHHKHAGAEEKPRPAT